MQTGLPIADVASLSGSYAAFGGVLVAFSLAGLFWYLTDGHTRGRAREQDDTGKGKAARPAAEEKAAPGQSARRRRADIGVRHVTVTVLYAMASLTMTSFLYANLSGEAAPQASHNGQSPAWAVAALLPYGVAFGLSVLMLFYGLTLIMLEQSRKQEAAWSYWVVACAGPAVVLRFLLTAGAEARRAICNCTPGGWLSTWAIFWIVLGSVVLAAALMLLGLEWRFSWWLPKFLGNRPAFPAAVVFGLVSLMTALGSLYFSGRGYTYSPGIGSVYASLWVAVGAVTLFALACGCVIGIRVDVKGAPAIRELLRERKNRKKQRAGFCAEAVWARYYEIRSGGTADPVFVIYVGIRDHDEAGRPALRDAFKLVEEQGAGQFSQAVTIRPQWEICDGLWPLVKLRLEFSGQVAGSADIVLRGRSRSSSWSHIADGGEVAITREPSRSAHVSLEECVPVQVDASAGIKSLIAEHAWKPAKRTDQPVRQPTG
jgi:hypothetical protein